MNFKLVKEIKLESRITKNSEIDATDLDGEKVMMNLDKGQYFMMNEVGSRVWELIEEPKTCVEIVQALLNEYEVEKEQCQTIVVEFLTKLKEADLVRIK